MNKRIVVDHESKVPPFKKIGVLGGMGQWATLDILQRIFRASVEYPVPQYGNRGYPSLNVQMLNRAPMQLNADGSYPDVLAPSEELIDAARKVGEDSDFLIVTSHTAHVFQKEIEQAAGKPVLSMIDVSAEEAKRRGCKRVGVMAIGLTLGKGQFQKALADRGIESMSLPQELGKQLEDEGIYQVQEGGVDDYAKVGVACLEYFRGQGVDGIILGCTEIPILLGNDSQTADIINPSQLIAEAAIKKSLEG